MNPARVDLLLKYVLVVAGQEDPGNRELGPIHFLKYVYLGDWGYAQGHDGETFTRAPWRFHHFGPWAEQVLARVEPVIRSLGAAERTFRNRVFQESVRWSLEDENLLSVLDREIPVEVSGTVKRAIREFGNDTYALLHHVYKTPPMLRAAPGDGLSFAPDEPAAVMPLTIAERGLGRASNPCVPLDRKERISLRKLRDRVRGRLGELSGARPGSKATPPRYDQVFEEGQKWLDSLAGDPVEDSEGQLIFSDEMWRSRGRREPGVP